MITMKNKNYEEQVKSLMAHIQEADAIVVGAASGMSAAAGYRHYYERDKDFVDTGTTILLMVFIIGIEPVRNAGRS